MVVRHPVISPFMRSRNDDRGTVGFRRFDDGRDGTEHHGLVARSGVVVDFVAMEALLPAARVHLEPDRARNLGLGHGRVPFLANPIFVFGGQKPRRDLGEQGMEGHVDASVGDTQQPDGSARCLGKESRHIPPRLRRSRV